MPELNDLTGQKFTRLSVIKKSENKEGYWVCKCVCGTIKEVRGDHLKEGSTKSCGCLNKEDNMLPEVRKRIMKELKLKNAKYNNLSHTKLYRIWYELKKKCYDVKYFKYKYYGKRGIKVCSQWKSNFLAFYNWAIQNGFDEKLKWQECTIDRINNNGNYEPSNCRWVTLAEQQRNKSNNYFITYNNETHCLAEWSKILKIDKHKVKEVLFNETGC